jgi:hypothetical protein
MSELSEMIGVTMRSVVNDNNERLTFTAEDGREWVLYHSQDCCESVNIEDITGNLDDLVGAPLTVSREDNSPDPVDAFKDRGYTPESFTWTFYSFATRKGHVVVRWLGESNGYYSESVSFVGPGERES